MTRRRTHPVHYDHLMGKLRRAARRRGAWSSFTQARREVCHLAGILRG